MALASTSVLVVEWTTKNGYCRQLCPQGELQLLPVSPGDSSRTAEVTQEALEDLSITRWRSQMPNHKGRPVAVGKTHLDCDVSETHVLVEWRNNQRAERLECFWVPRAEEYEVLCETLKRMMNYLTRNFSHSKQLGWINWHFGEAILRSHSSFPFSPAAPTSKEHKVFLRLYIAMWGGIVINTEFWRPWFC